MFGCALDDRSFPVVFLFSPDPPPNPFASSPFPAPTDNALHTLFCRSLCRCQHPWCFRRFCYQLPPTCTSALPLSSTRWRAATNPRKPSVKALKSHGSLPTHLPTTSSSPRPKTCVVTPCECSCPDFSPSLSDHRNSSPSCQGWYWWFPDYNHPVGSGNSRRNQGLPLCHGFEGPRSLECLGE